MRTSNPKLHSCGGSEVRTPVATSTSCGLLNQSHTRSMSCQCPSIPKFANEDAAQSGELRNRDTGHQYFARGSLMRTFAKVPAEKGCECWHRTTSRGRLSSGVRRQPFRPRMAKHTKLSCYRNDSGGKCVSRSPANAGFISQARSI